MTTLYTCNLQNIVHQRYVNLKFLNFSNSQLFKNKYFKSSGKFWLHFNMVHSIPEAAIQWFM